MTETLQDTPDTETELSEMALAPVARMPVATVSQVAHEQTVAEGRVAAVNALLHTAYSKAGCVEITPEEAAELQAPFEDGDFRRGAAGKENLIYIQHSALRGRLNKVLGIGKWALVVRNKWAEDYRTAKGNEASRVYVEAVMLVRGAFAAESIGDMTYYKNNDSQNFGDAFEGAKSAALRRCAKELGVGLQAWDKTWCDAWLSKYPIGPQGSPSVPRTPMAKSTTPTQTVPKTASPAPAKVPVEATEAHKKRWLELLKPVEASAQEYYVNAGSLLPIETLTDLPLRFVPATKEAADAQMHAIQAFADGGEPPAETKPEPEVVEGESVTGFIKTVTKKETKKPGHFRYGILVVDDMRDKSGGTWINTFSDTDAAEAQQMVGQLAMVRFTVGQYGNELIERGISDAGEVTP